MCANAVQMKKAVIAHRLAPPLAPIAIGVEPVRKIYFSIWQWVPDTD